MLNKIIRINTINGNLQQALLSMKLGAIGAHRNLAFAFCTLPG